MPRQHFHGACRARFANVGYLVIWARLLPTTHATRKLHRESYTYFKYLGVTISRLPSAAGGCPFFRLVLQDALHQYVIPRPAERELAPSVSSLTRVCPFTPNPPTYLSFHLPATDTKRKKPIEHAHILYPFLNVHTYMIEKTMPARPSCSLSERKQKEKEETRQLSPDLTCSL